MGAQIVAKSLLAGLREYAAPICHPFRWLAGEDVGQQAAVTMAKDVGIPAKRLEELRKPPARPLNPALRDADELLEKIWSADLGDLREAGSFRCLSPEALSAMLGPVNRSLVVGLHQPGEDFAATIAEHAREVSLDFNERYIFGLRLLKFIHKVPEGT